MASGVCLPARKVMTLILKLEPRLLHEKLPEIDLVADKSDLPDLATMLIECMETNKGVGLAANQVGLSCRVFVMKMHCTQTTIAAFNPRILWSADKTVEMIEGCLSYPGRYLTISRPRQIRATWFDQYGKEKTRLLNKIDARVFQHELDHLNGITFDMRQHEYQI